MSIKNWSKFISLGLIWGSSFMWIKIAVHEVSPLTLVLYRLFFSAAGAVVFAVVGRANGKELLRRWPVFLLLGLCNLAIPIGLIAWAEKSIPSGQASILQAAGPLFTTLLASIFLTDDPLSWKKIIGIMVGFSGVYVLTGNGLDMLLNSSLLAQGAVLLAALMYAACGIFARRFTADLSTETLSLGQLGYGFVAMAVMIPLIEGGITIPQLPITWFALVFMGVFGSCIATQFFYGLLHTIGPSRTNTSIYLVGLVGMSLGVIFMGEQPDWRLFVGGALVLGGIAIVNLKFKPGSSPRGGAIPAVTTMGED